MREGIVRGRESGEEVGSLEWPMTVDRDSKGRVPRNVEGERDGK